MTDETRRRALQATAKVACAAFLLTSAAVGPALADSSAVPDLLPAEVTEVAEVARVAVPIPDEAVAPAAAEVAVDGAELAVDVNVDVELGAVAPAAEPAPTPVTPGLLPGELELPFQPCTMEDFRSGGNPMCMAWGPPTPPPMPTAHA